MRDLEKRGASPSGKDAEAVRVVARHVRGRREMVLYQVLALFLVACSAGYVLTPTRSTTPPPPVAAQATLSPMENTIDEVVRDERKADAAAVAKPSLPSRITTGSGRAMTPRRAKEPEPAGDPTQDLSDFIPPGQNLTSGELIEELHKHGIHEGIGAFQPPGTSPPLIGLAVPDDFELPEGYVRHSQATDDGQRIDPILMFSPDYEFFDDNGNRVAIPDNLVVPPELAPPGFPIHDIEIPPKREPGDLSR